LLEALDKDVIEQLRGRLITSAATFVKDEGLLDRFDQVFNKDRQRRAGPTWPAGVDA
jgi:hypothetical protein